MRPSKIRITSALFPILGIEYSNNTRAEVRLFNYFLRISISPIQAFRRCYSKSNGLFLVNLPRIKYLGSSKNSVISPE